MPVIDALCDCGASKAAEIGGLAPLFLKRAQGFSFCVLCILFLT
jgi:hypothetical protein